MKLSNGSFGSFALQSSTTIPPTTTTKTFAWRHIPTLTSYYLDSSTGSFLWGNGTHLFNTSLSAPVFSSSGKLLWIDLQDDYQPYLVLNHTSFSFSPGLHYLAVACSTCL
jgi:hypothetical protein